MIGLHRHSNRCNWAVEAVAGDRVSLDCLSMTLLFSPFPSGDLAEWAGRFKGEPNPRAERNEDGRIGYGRIDWLHSTLFP